MAATCLPLEILRQSGRPHGVMAAHFRWPTRALHPHESVVQEQPNWHSADP